MMSEATSDKGQDEGRELQGLIDGIVGMI